MIRRKTSFWQLDRLSAIASVGLLSFSNGLAEDLPKPIPWPRDEPSERSDPSDVFFQGYLAVRDAEKAEAAGDLAGAKQRLLRAKKMFDSVQKLFPEWKPALVKARVEKTDESIARLK